MIRLSLLDFAKWQQAETNYRLTRLRHAHQHRLLPPVPLATIIEREARVCRLTPHEFAKHFCYNTPFDNGVECCPEDRFLIFG